MSENREGLVWVLHRHIFGSFPEAKWWLHSVAILVGMKRYMMSNL